MDGSQKYIMEKWTKILFSKNPPHQKIGEDYNLSDDIYKILSVVPFMSKKRGICTHSQQKDMSIYFMSNFWGYIGEATCIPSPFIG